MMNGNEDKGDLVIRGGKVKFGHLSGCVKLAVIVAYIILTFWAVSFLIGVVSVFMEL